MSYGPAYQTALRVAVQPVWPILRYGHVYVVFICTAISDIAYYIYTNTRAHYFAIVQMSVAFCLPLLFSPSFFAYMLYVRIIQLPPGGQGHPHPPLQFPDGIC